MKKSSKMGMLSWGVLTCCMALGIVGILTDIVIAENWVQVFKGKDHYFFYDKDSVRDIEKGIKEVYTAAKTQKSTSKYQNRIDCNNHKYAEGEVIGWVGEKEVYRNDWSRNGWQWSPITEKNLLSKVYKAVCSKK